MPPSEAKARPRLGDAFAGVSVALVAIPQSLAYAELAAAAAFLSSPYLQAGPVATTSLLTFGVLSSIADGSDYVVLAALLALLVGTVRVAIGLLRLGAIAYLMSQPVLTGFTSAAAVLIVSSQLPTALGTVPPNDGVIEGAYWTLLHPSDWHLPALALSSLTILLMRGGRRLHPLFPGVLVAVVLGTLHSAFFSYGGPVLGEVPTSLPRPSLALPWERLPELLVGGLAVALVGFAEASSVARTYAARERTPWNADREWLGQGAANLAAGIFGGFPVGASFSRSALNREAGAKTPWSGVVMALVIGAFLPFMGVLSAMPKAILAAIIIGAIVSLFRPGEMLALWPLSRPQFALSLTTFVLTLALSPRIDQAVLLGIGLSFGVHLWREGRLGLETQVEGNTLHLRPTGVLWFGSAYLLEEAFTEGLSQHPEATGLELHLGGLGRVDLSAALVVERLLGDAREAGLSVTLQGVPPTAEKWSNLWRGKT